MLLNKVEQIVSKNLNVIRREVNKVPIGNYSYSTNLGGIWVSEEDDYFYLSTSTLTYIEIGDKDYPYTTFEKQTLYDNGEESPPIKNDPITVNGVTIGYSNVLGYLHLPDFLMTQLLIKGIDVKAVTKEVIVLFKEGVATVYKHYSDVVTPYYVFESDFNYNYEYADTLAQVIGVFDVYKRGLLNTEGLSEEEKKRREKRALYYLFFPYVSLIVYKYLRSTLFPLHTYQLVTKVSQILTKDGKDVIGFYTDDTLTKLQGLADTLRQKIILK